ncbi:MAG TPA: hypothetical protein VEF76_11175 [Patescibacteria group bacterium]|nr:hypothetical protein [Patescibacteria group bacterium]
MKPISAKDIDAERAHISEVVSDGVVETFNSMFGQAITAGDLAEKFQSEKGSVYSSIKLHQANVDVEFCFRFDIELLLQAAELIFTRDYLDANPVQNDIACEIANIVCSKVKAYLNEKGFDTEMGFPFIPPADENPLLKNRDMVHMHFYYGGEQSSRGVGVVVNFFADDKPPVT